MILEGGGEDKAIMFPSNDKIRGKKIIRMTMNELKILDKGPRTFADK